MRIAIVHYHLQPGGVTSVIHRQSRLLTKQGIRHVILASDPDVPDIPIATVHGLRYRENSGKEEADALYSEITEAASQALDGSPDLWHFHNPTLGKNDLMPELVLRLAKENQRIVLQIHDLAEDGRLENFRRIADPSRLHFTGPRIAHTFLNERDRDLFLKAGLPENRAFFLPNSIQEIPDIEPPGEGPALVFYPVRGIRRKNLGEILLLALLSPAGTRFVISRAPSNPQWLAKHDAWRAFAITHGIPVDFDASGRMRPAPGEPDTFESWIRHSTHFISTSVSEGFGMSFIEAVLWKRPLIARALAHLPHGHGNEFYQSIQTQNGDFGAMEEIQQREILIHLLTHPEACDRITMDGIPATKWLKKALSSRTPAKQITAIDGCKLPDIYHTLVEQNETGITLLNPEIIRDFFTSDKIHPLASGPGTAQSKVVIFDIYGTLLAAAAGGVKPDPSADPMLREILSKHGFTPPPSPSTALHEAVLRHHATSDFDHPEIDLRKMWREVIAQRETGDGHRLQFQQKNLTHDLTDLVIELEEAWHPAVLIEGVEAMLRRLAAKGFSFGVLSNAQCNTMHSLGHLAGWFARDLTILSYQHGCTKPSDSLFLELKKRLAARGISPGEVWYVGNDPLQDIIPATEHGFHTALFEGHPDSFRPGACSPALRIPHWDVFDAPHTHTNPPVFASPRDSCGER